MEEILKNLGNAIRRQRLNMNMTTQDLASLLDVSAGLINNIENAKSDTFNLELLHRISDKLEIPILSLLLGSSLGIKDIIPSMPDDSLPPKYEASIIGRDAVLISENLKRITEAYLNTISKLNFDKESIEILTEKILYELNYIGKISDHMNNTI